MGRGYKLKNLFKCLQSKQVDIDEDMDGWDSLPGVKRDKKLISQMLSMEEYDDIEIILNECDIASRVANVLLKWQQEKLRTRKYIGRLHFHFSGHGINNQVVSITKTMNDEVKSLIPVGECLVGTDGSFCAIRIIQHLLTFACPEVITVTLDCCRNLKRGLMQTIRLPWSPDIPRKCWLKMAVVHSTLETLCSNDCN